MQENYTFKLDADLWPGIPAIYEQRIAFLRRLRGDDAPKYNQRLDGTYETALKFVENFAGPGNLDYILKTEREYESFGRKASRLCFVFLRPWNSITLISTTDQRVTIKVQGEQKEDLAQRLKNYYSSARVMQNND